MSFIREPRAREFYPGDCQQQLFAFLNKYTPPADLPDTLIGAVVPHASWKFSGKVAARTLQALFQHSAPEICVLFGADHTGLKKHTIFPEGAWHTPLGKLPIEAELAADFYQAHSRFISKDLHAHDLEHSIEVITPMIAYFWPNIHILPLILVPDARASELGKTLHRLIKASGKTAIYVASTDLTHYGRVYGLFNAGTGKKALHWLRNNDRKMIDCLCEVQSDNILNEATENKNACGAGALTALCCIAKANHAQQGRLIEYTTSHGDGHPKFFKTGVGYAGIVF